MKLHEYQAKEKFATAGIPTPSSMLADSVEGVLDAAGEIGYPVAIKAQVQVGGRGKAGGIEVVDSAGAAEDAADSILGMDLKGFIVDSVLVEEAIDFTDEYYVGVTMDREERQPVVMVSARGGVNIEDVASREPEAIVREHVDPAYGFFPFEARRAVFDAGVSRDVARGTSDIVQKLYEVWEGTDATEAEINPVMVTVDGDVVAADAVLNIDDDALFRHPELAELEEEYYESPLERKAGEYGFDYVRLDGNIGIIGNGAGLVMATLDLVDYFGGAPANFLDIGGGAQASRVRDALDVVFSDDRVDAVLVNIFGGITRGDEVAEGINTALDSFESVSKPIVVRLAGTNAEEGLAILDTSRLAAESTLEAAVEQVVAYGQEDSG